MCEHQDEFTEAELLWLEKVLIQAKATIVSFRLYRTEFESMRCLEELEMIRRKVRDWHNAVRDEREEQSE